MESKDRSMLQARLGWAILLLVTTPVSASTPPPAEVRVEPRSILVPAPTELSCPARFGIAVALDEDRLFVGADGRRDGPPCPGMVVIFVRGPGPEWHFDRVLASPDPEAGDEFGASLVLDGDRLLVGSPGRLGERGGAWCFRLSPEGTSVDTVIDLAVDDARRGDRFGESVALDGPHVALGAPRADVGGFLDRGRVVITRLDDRFARPWRDVRPRLSTTGLRFGTSIAWGPTLAIGAPGADVQDSLPIDVDRPPRRPVNEGPIDRAGAVMIHQRQSPHRTLAILHRHDPAPLERTGTTVCFLGDTPLAGAPRAFTGAVRGGKLISFGRPPAELGVPSHSDGGFGGTLVAAGDRFAAGVPGRRDRDGRIDVGIRIGDCRNGCFRVRWELIGLGGTRTLLALALSPQGGLLAIGTPDPAIDDGPVLDGMVRVVTLDSLELEAFP